MANEIDRDTLVQASGLSVWLINKLAEIAINGSGSGATGRAAVEEVLRCDYPQQWDNLRNLGYLAAYDTLVDFVASDMRTPEEVDTIVREEEVSPAQELGEEIRSIMVNGVPVDYVIERLSDSKIRVNRPDGSNYIVEVD